MDACVIWWVKRDARLTDNCALQKAIETGLPIVPIFVFEPSIMRSPEYSSMHAHAQVSAMNSLEACLMVRQAECLVYHCEIEEAFERLLEKVQIIAVFSQEETGPENTFSRDRRMAVWFKNRDIPWIETSQGGVVRRCPDRNRQDDLRHSYYLGSPLKAPKYLKPMPSILKPEALKPVPSLKDLGFKPAHHLLQRITERDASATVRGFLAKRGQGYRYRISSPNTAFESGSRLSIHLAWGTISSRSIFSHVSEARQIEDISSSREKDLNSFRSRLHWRDHFIQRLESAPWIEFEPLNPLFANLPYHEDPSYNLKAWLVGETGFPMVDACMRCLSFTGFLNFRMRAMVTSFATHALRLDWKEINAPLAALMYDYEPGIHISQLHMQAGITGMNAMRVYSPAKQLVEQDPQVSFVRKWLPEMASISSQDILLSGNGPVPGYIEPIVNFDAETLLMKDAINTIKKSIENERIAPKLVEKFGSKFRRSHVYKPKKSVSQLSLQF